MGIERAPAMWPAAYSRVGSDVDHHGAAAVEAIGELVGGDLLDCVSGAEVGVGEDVDVGDVGGGHVAERGPQLGDAVAGEPVDDALAVATGLQQAGVGEAAEVVGGVGDALVDLGGDLLDRAFALGEHIDDLGPAAVAERLGHRRERVEQRVLRFPSRGSSPCIQTIT